MLAAARSKLCSSVSAWSGVFATRILRAILNKSWRQHPTRLQLYGHLPPITKTIQVRRTRHAGHCWRSRDGLMRDVLLWTPTHGRAKAGRPARTYIQQLCEDTGCCPEELPRAMNDREEWRERVRDIRATSAIWWWWYSIIQLQLFQSNTNNLYTIICFQEFCLVLIIYTQLYDASNQVLGGWIARDNGQDQIVRSGNYCCSSIRVVSIDENKTQSTKDYHDSYSNHMSKPHSLSRG